MGAKECIAREIVADSCKYEKVFISNLHAISRWTWETEVKVTIKKDEKNENDINGVDKYSWLKENLWWWLESITNDNNSNK